jgi:hypothetical protein
MKYYEVTECKYRPDIVGSIVTIESDFDEPNAPYYWGWMTVVKGRSGIFGTIALPHTIHDQVLLKKTDNNWRKCKHCGKFISYKQMEEQKDVMFHFIPDSEITTEEAHWAHRHCVEVEG